MPKRATQKLVPETGFSVEDIKLGEVGANNQGTDFVILETDGGEHGPQHTHPDIKVEAHLGGPDPTEGRRRK